VLVNDSIFLELEWLHLLADDGAVGPAFSGVLRGSRMWRLVHPRPRRFPSQAVAIVATAALFPRVMLAESPARAATAEAVEQQVTVSVVDAATHKPVAGAELRSQSSGARKGVTDSAGRARVPVSAIKGQDLVIEKAGYRPMQIVASRAKAGSSVFVGIARAEDAVAAAPASKPPATVKPAAAKSPTPERQAAATPRPRPTPRPEVWKEPAAARATPVAEDDEPTPEPETTARPAPKTTPKPMAKKPGKKRMRTMRAASRRAPEMVGRHAGRYKVFPGDTLWSIARKQYGNPYLWSALYRSNRDKIRDPGLIYPGQWLQVPSTSMAAGRHRGAKITVHSGDTLWELAGHHLGDPYRWRSLYRLNRSVIQDPGHIFPGQVLRLPTV
jgi:nucleoid-associated protein YgaU